MTEKEILDEIDRVDNELRIVGTCGNFRDTQCVCFEPETAALKTRLFLDLDVLESKLERIDG